MHKRLLLGLVLFAVGALLSLHAQTPPAPAAPAAMPAGQILAAKVTGNVTMTVGGGAPVKLNNNDSVSQHATVITDKEKESSVVLVFSNGATTQLGSDTQLVIDEFLQDPFSAAIKVADLNEEPTTSRTKLRLTHGELVGNVKHLKHDQGSAFTVETPVGAAGIRGTTFRIVFRPSGTGLAFFSLSTVEGNVAFQQPGAGGGGNATTPGNGTPGDTGAATGAGTTPGTGTPADAGAGTTPGAGGNTGGASTTTGAAGASGGAGGTAGGGGAGGIAVTGGQEVVITVNVTVNPTTNVMTVSTPVVVTNTTNISAATMATVSQQAVAIATTAAAVTFTPTPPVTPPASTPPAGDSGSGSSSTNTPSGDSSNSGTGTAGNTSTGTNTNTNTSTGTNTNTNTNTGSNLGNTPPQATAPTPRVTTGDGKSD